MQLEEEEEADNGNDPESDDPDGIEGVTEEFMVWLARAVKDAQADEKHCYHCSSPEHFIHNCPLMKTARDKKQLNGKDGMAITWGSLGPSCNSKCHEEPPKGGPRGVEMTSQTQFLNLDPFQWWYRIENTALVKINGKSCRALLDNSAQVNTIMLRYVHEHSLEMGPISDLMGFKVAYIGLGNTYTRPLGYVVIWVQVDGILGSDEDQIALMIPDFSKFAARVPIILGMPTICWVVNVMREVEMDTLAMPWANARVAHLLAVHRMMTVGIGNDPEEKIDANDYNSLMCTQKTETIEPFSCHIVTVKYWEGLYRRTY